MTDPEFADATYVEPITPEFVEKVIARERPDALLATLGGQTALNTAVALHEAGVLDKYGVELIGADIDAIQRGEDRQLFKEIVAAGPAATVPPVRAGSATRWTRSARPWPTRPAGGDPAVVHDGRARLGHGAHAARPRADRRRRPGRLARCTRCSSRRACSAGRSTSSS